MLLAEVVAATAMAALGILPAMDTGPGRAVIYAIHRWRRRRRSRRAATQCEPILCRAA
jgi:hypothetical protein